MLLLLVIPGSQILIYPMLWILMPSESTVTAQARHTPRASLTVTDRAETTKTFASVVRFLEIADFRAASQEVESSVTLRLGGTSVTLPLPGSRSSQPSPDQLAFVDAITSHLTVRPGQRPSPPTRAGVALSRETYPG